MKTFWITKYALSTGIIRKECRVWVASPDVPYAAGDGFFCRIGKDAFETEDEARSDAIQRAKRKRKALAKAGRKMSDLIAMWIEAAKCAGKEV